MKILFIFKLKTVWRNISENIDFNHQIAYSQQYYFIIQYTIIYNNIYN